MNTKLFTLAAVGSMMLAACSSEEIVEDKALAQNEIAFTITTGKPSRALSLWNDQNRPFDKMYVSAKSSLTNTSAGQEVYFANDEFYFNGTSWRASGSSRLWPSYDLDFYAYVGNVKATMGEDGSYSYESSAYDSDDYALTDKTQFFAEGRGIDRAPVITNFKVNPDVSQQVDLLVAYLGGQNKSNLTGTRANLNFRHALSQVVFKARNENSNIYIVVYGITLVGPRDLGTFTFPIPYVIKPEGASETMKLPVSSANSETPLTASAWQVSNDASTTDMSRFNVNLTNSTGEGIALSAFATFDGDGKEVDRTQNLTDDLAKAMLMIPQHAEKATEKSAFLSSPHILLNCVIYNVSDEKKDPSVASNRTMIWGDETKTGAECAKNILIPFGYDWIPGYKHGYTIVFGKDGGNGYDPGTLDPVSTAIEFTISVESFQDADWTEIDDKGDVINKNNP